jgi:hypothetical protein
MVVTCWFSRLISAPNMIKFSCFIFILRKIYKYESVMIIAFKVRLLKRVRKKNTMLVMNKIDKTTTITILCY